MGEHCPVAAGLQRQSEILANQESSAAMIDPHDALIYTMVMVSAADGDMTDAEMRTIGDVVKFLPVFRDFDSRKLLKVAADCAALMNDAKGLDRALTTVVSAIPRKLHETAYAIACDVAAADGRAAPEIKRFLDLLRESLGIDRLAAAAIERTTQARHMTA
jgi:tellurite resistance protein